MSPAEEAAAFLNLQPGPPDSSEWERQAWSTRLDRLLDREWSREEAASLAAAISADAAATLQRRAIALPATLITEVDARFPPDEEARAERASQPLSMALTCERLQASDLEAVSDATVALVLQSAQHGQALFDRAGLVFGLLPSERAARLTGLTGTLAELQRVACGARGPTPALDGELEAALAFDCPDRTDPVAQARPAAAWVLGLPPLIRDWAVAAVRRLAPTRTFAGFVHQALTRRP